MGEAYKIERRRPTYIQGACVRRRHEYNEGLARAEGLVTHTQASKRVCPGLFLYSHIHIE